MGRPAKREDTKDVFPTTFRLGTRYLFALRVAARMGGRDGVAVIEDGIMEAVGKVQISRPWEELYDDDESVAMLNLLSLHDYRPNKAEEALQKFINAHPLFWYTETSRKIVARDRSVVLWGHRRELLRLWEKTRAADYWATANEMAKILKAAKVPVPAYGPKK